MNDVTDIIVARSHQPEALRTMVVWSVTAHVVLLAVILFAPTREVSDMPRTVMTISLGGAPGPRAGGMTPEGGRSVQQVAPPQPTRRVESAPAPTRPAMTLPDPRARTRPTPKPQQAPRDTSSRTVSTGEEVREGSARTETGARGQGFGLSTGGGGGTGVQLDVANFCCPEYLDRMVMLIQQNWNRDQGIAGATVMKFTIQRDGTIVMTQIERSSGFVGLDNAAQRAILLTKLPPLPAAYSNATLGLHVTFDYHR